MVRLRFAPSPTGYLHLGNLRGILFNYLFVKKNLGQFILRIDDTDLERSNKKYEKSFIDDLTYFNIEFDEGPHLGGPYGPYRQSERLNIYQYYANILLEKGFAKKTINEGKEAILLNGKLNIAFSDIVFGTIQKDVEDFVIIKSNGYPTYHFSTVIDDYLMKITHIVRGQDHLSNTAKHVLLYQYFDWPIPAYAHYSLTLNLSKRDQSKSLQFFRDQGYIKEAILNSSMLLGWYPKDQKEKFNIFDKISEFDLKDLKRVNIQFDLEKLNWLSTLYLKEKSLDWLYEHIQPYLKSLNVHKKNYSRAKIELMIQISLDKMYCLSQFIECNGFFFKDIDYTSFNTIKNHLLMMDEIKLFLTALINLVKKQEQDFFEDLKNFKILMHEILELTSLKKGKKLFLTLRYTLTGSLEGPELFYIVHILGKNYLLNQLEAFTYFLEKINNEIL